MYSKTTMPHLDILSIWLLLHVVKVNVAIKLTISQKYLAVTLTLLLTLFYVYYELAIYLS